jgi:acetyl esterase/lipase
MRHGRASGWAVRRRTFLAASALGMLAPRHMAAAQTLAADPPWFSLVDPDLRDKARDLLAGKARAVQAPPSGLPAGVTKRTVPADPPVTLYVVEPRTPPRRRGAILHIHGGGFTGGTAFGGLASLKSLADRLDCVIVTVEYRLAPATRFPGALDDNYAALRWLFQNAADLGVDPARIVVMGESAGGGHAAMLAIAARDRGEFDLALQLLVYPMLDDRTGSARPQPAHIGQLVWTESKNRKGWSALLGSPAGEGQPPYGAVPARVERLAGLPPTFIVVGSLDLFAEEDIQYARRLIAAGVPTDLLVVSGAFHASDWLAPSARSSVRFNTAIDAALRKTLSPS